MLRGCWLPATENWVPLLVMSLTVGLFEAVFFRGFMQGRLQASLGSGPAVAGAASLYALYHVGYGMGAGELVFLFGLGVVYAVAYRLAENVLVLWPLLTPLGAWFSNMEAGDIQLPLASIAGFVDVLAVMALVSGWRTGTSITALTSAAGGGDDPDPPPCRAESQPGPLAGKAGKAPSACRGCLYSEGQVGRGGSPVRAATSCSPISPHGALSPLECPAAGTFLMGCGTLLVCQPTK
jgi:hypothetical protein